MTLFEVERHETLADLGWEESRARIAIERIAADVQHCSGAPGMINALAALPGTQEIDEILLAAGELTWAAGPIAKLPGLCHGVPGSGYAFLNMFRRTGDEKWLQRARRFAMHAIGQTERGVEAHGQRKYSVWTGDLGLALYLWDCVRGVGEFPMMDVF